MDIPAFVFQPLTLRGAKGHPAIVWVHENIRGHLYEHYIPYIREATAKGYIVIAPEYRGSLGYGQAFYDAIDYGGTEVDDVVTAAEVLKAKYPQVDPARIGIMGWSHGGMITLLSIFRNPTLFKAALRSRKSSIAETMIYDNPPGGHTFDRRVDPNTWQPENTREQRDSWNRVWTFLDWNLDPFHAAAPASTK